MIVQIIAAVLGTMAFAILFGVPKEYYICCGIGGGAGWVIYCLCIQTRLTAAEATFFAAAVVVFLARYFAVWLKCPVTVFLTAGIFPIVPGGGIYWTAYYLVMGETGQAMHSGFEAIKAVIAIVLGIVVIFEIPGKFFHHNSVKENSHRFYI